MNTTALKDKVILIVDDYIVNCELFSIFVSELGAIPLIALNGLECINVVNQQKVDMILMDNKMPFMNGIDATKRLRSIPNGKDIIIIGISVSEDEIEKAACIEAGMNQLLAKLTLNIETLQNLGNQFFPDNNRKIQTNVAINSCGCKESIAPSLDITSESFSVMNYEKALKEFENDEPLLTSLISDFCVIIQNQLTGMRTALRQKDFEFIRNEAHGIKGGAANLCALPLSQSAATLEQSCKQQPDSFTVSQNIENLAEQINAFDRFIKEKVSAF